MPEPDNPLEFVTTRELINELGRRSHGVVVAWENSITDNEMLFQMEFRGSRVLAIGLLRRAEFGMLNELDIEVEDNEVEDNEEGEE